MPRVLPTVAGVAVIATAAAGATGLGQSDVTSVTSAGLTLPKAAGSGSAVHAERRAEVIEASRGFTRQSLARADRAQALAVRDAAARDRSLDALEEAAARRSEEIREEIARQRRIERRNRWVLPVPGGDITATFGEVGLWSSAHTGLDFAASEGTPVGSAAAGEVTSTGYDGAYGNQVIVTHDDGTQTWYCHLSSITVETGESVEAGTTIGAVGSTGNTTGPHLHLEVRPGGGEPVDPYTYLKSEGAF
jgi:murein DD-endopeptidase MepM/ murein hydrolase activator NlpD